MKKIILTLITCVFAFNVNANTINQTEVNAYNLALVQDCHSYASNAANAELEYESSFTLGLVPYAYAVTYAYWYGVCDSHNPDRGELLEPVFL